MKASRSVIAGMIAGARGRSPVEVAEVRGAIVVDRVRADLVDPGDRAMISEGREDLIKIAAVRGDLAVVAASAVRDRVADARRSAATIIAIARRVRPSRRGKWW